jgi:hypothetical protein
LHRFLVMPDELKPIVTAPVPQRSFLSAFGIVAGIFVGSIVTLYLLLVLVGGMGWDGY